MKSVRRIFAVTAIAFAAVCATALPASAQSKYTGSFTLSHEVQWQMATLPAGDYTFEIRAQQAPAILTVRGPHGAQFVTALVVDRIKGGRSKLVIERRSGSDAAYVSELFLAEAGVYLRYGAPKPTKDVELASAPIREEVLVAVNRKK